MKDFDLDKSINKEESIYRVAMVIARRARQVHEKVSEELRSELGELDNEEDQEEENEERIKVIEKYDNMPKPIEVALKEYTEDKLVFSEIEEEEEEEEE